MILMNQYLQVELIVHRDDMSDFESSVTDFLNDGGFDSIDPESNKHLVLALRTKEAIAYRGYDRRQSDIVDSRDDFALLRNDQTIAPGEKQFYRYVHVWRLGEVTDLDITRLMRLSADDDAYRHIDSLVVRETQDIVFGVPWLSRAPAFPLAKPIDVIRVTRQLATRELGAYLFSSGRFLPERAADGFNSLGYFQNVTGLLNTVTEYWQTEREDLGPISKTPAELTEAAVGDTPPLKAHSGKTSFVFERFASYVTSADMKAFQRVEAVRVARARAAGGER
jgi:hypothetical protein